MEQILKLFFQKKKMSYNLFYLFYLSGALIAFFIGSIPFSYFIGKLKGIDIRQVGSGNVGASNVMRTCGKVAGFFAYFLDIAKGIAAVLVVDILSLCLFHFTNSPQGFIYLPFFAVIGHVYTPFLAFKGGKGVATSSGIMMIISPLPLLFSLMIFFISFIIFRISSVSSMLACVFYSLFVTSDIIWQWVPLQFLSSYQKQDSNTILLIGIFLTLFIIYKHKSNIIRLLKGNENTFQKRK